MNPQTGEIAWKNERPIGTAHATPLLVEHHGQKDILGATSGVLFGYAGLIPGLSSPTSFLVIPLSWLVTFVLAALLGSLFPAPRPEQVRGLTWQSVMRGEFEEGQRGDDAH